jgi:hypothetical protein
LAIGEDAWQLGGRLNWGLDDYGERGCDGGKVNWWRSGDGCKGVLYIIMFCFGADYFMG